ncbi:MAG: twin-arginine translocase subunit TatC [Phycisphaerales bacterium]
MTERPAVMSFGDHLDELRKRLMLALIAPLPLAIVLFFFAEPIRTFLCRPLLRALRANHLPAQLQTLNPVETVLLDVKLAIILSLVISAPWILWQAWLFIAPGLYRHERRFVRFLLPASALLTLTGLSLLHFVLLPLMLTVLVGFGVPSGATGLPAPIPLPATATDGALAAPANGGAPGADAGAAGSANATPPTDADDVAARGGIRALAEHPAQYRPGDTWIKVPENLLCVAIAEAGKLEVLAVPLGRNVLIAQQYRLSEYIDFVLLTTAGIAIAFQMPLVILLLGWLDIVRLETLKRSRKYAMFICAVVAAVVTPSPDAVSMIVTLVPLYFLYELGVIALRFLPAWRVLGLDPPAGDRPRPRSAPPQPVTAAGSVPRGGSEHDGS